jgi:hypothetical protein
MTEPVATSGRGVAAGTPGSPGTHVQTRTRGPVTPRFGSPVPGPATSSSLWAPHPPHPARPPASPVGVASTTDGDHAHAPPPAVPASSDCDASTFSGIYAELHAASAFSFLRAGSGVEALVDRAADLGLSALALCDYMTLAGVVRFQAACERRGVHGIVGCELAVADPVFGDRATPAHLVVLAEGADGYARLCRLLTEANLAHPERPFVPWRALEAAAKPEPGQSSAGSASAGLILLTGGREGTLARLALAGRSADAVDVARRYRRAFGPDRVFVEVQHHREPDSVWLLDRLAAIAAAAELPLVATNGVRHATRGELAS